MGITKESIDKDDLLKLYELAINEEQFFTREYNHQVSFFSGILSVLTGSTVTGLFIAEKWYEFLVLCFGPVSIFIISLLAIFASSRPYRRFLEIVTARAKIEQLLGLTAKPSTRDGKKDYKWSSEPIISSRHISNREMFPSSEAFIKHYDYRFWVSFRNSFLGKESRKLPRGHQFYITIFFCTFLFISIMLLAIVIWLLRELRPDGV